MANVLSPSASGKRITSLDALRAFTLLGILIVHANNGFGFSYDGIQTISDSYISVFNDLFLINKCNTIFAVLFGVSFYLILRNPKNSSSKFVWRCFLLALIGLFNKLFYTYDALMWYGLWGMILVLFRNLKPKYLILSCVCMLMLSVVFAKFSIGDLLFGSNSNGGRYGVNKSFLDVLSYPYAVSDYVRTMLNDGGLGILARFLFGYWIAKIGFIENIDKQLKKNHVIILWSVFGILLGAELLMKVKDVHIILIGSLINYSASLAYASVLLYAYYHCGMCKRILSLFEPYGKLGLTNYSLGGILGVIFINEFGLGLYKYGVTFIVLFFIAFFLLQALFSFYWLRYFTYGPMEYIWRVATERKMIPFRRLS